MAVICTKCFEKMFHGDTYREAYDKACKFVAKTFLAKEKQAEVGEVLWNIRKKEDDPDSPACELSVYVGMEEGQHIEGFCNRCREFHRSFYINQEYNCSACRMQAYRSHFKEHLHIKKHYRKEQIHRKLNKE